MVVEYALKAETSEGYKKEFMNLSVTRGSLIRVGESLQSRHTLDSSRTPLIANSLEQRATSYDISSISVKQMCKVTHLIELLSVHM